MKHRKLHTTRSAFTASILLFSVEDCGPLADPGNGEVDFPATTYGSVAQYTCSGGCVPVGDTTRTCTADGTWSGSTPQCPGIVKILHVTCK